jgi:hypothetical protein
MIAQNAADILRDHLELVVEGIAGGSNRYARGGHARSARLLESLYDKLGVKFQAHDWWIASGARITPGTSIQHGRRE